MCTRWCYAQLDLVIEKRTDLNMHVYSDSVGEIGSTIWIMSIVQQSVRVVIYMGLDTW